MTGDIEAILETGTAAAVELTASHVAKAGAARTNCASCEQTLVGHYCANCGQPSKTGRRSIRHLLQDFVEDLINLDSRILRTARALLIEPGELPSAFREGRTQPYVPPIRLYFFVTLVFFLLLGFDNIAIIQIEVVAKPVHVTWINGNPFVPNPAYEKADQAVKMELRNEDDPDVKNYTGPLIPISKEKAQRPGGVFNFSTQMHYFSPIGAYHATMSQIARDRLKVDAMTDSKNPDSQKVLDWFQKAINGFLARIAADPAALNDPLTAWIPRALFLLLPLYALLVGLFHIRRRKDYFLVDHLVFSLSIHTFAFVVLTAAVLLGQLINGEIVVWLVIGGISLYIFLAMKHFYGQSWFLTSVKFVGISGIYVIFFLMPALLAVLALSALGGSFG
ncbi:MAG TPA: DUF3667 domain-containing protein [Rhizomicrobium sp.]|jgi:hypothetical protein|nr:DUF3667 domain-containing protein [Rhizomicrobium sp.]